MRKFPFAVIVALVLFLGGCQTSQPRPNHSQDTAAQHGLATLRQIVNAGNYASLGFESEAEVRQATLGEPLQVYRVQLDALRAFTGNTDPETLLVDIRRSLYPVKVGDRVATSIFVTGSREGWRASELGNAAVARLVSRYRHGAGDFVVHVPAMKSWFVADRVEGKLMLTPVMDDPRTKLRAGETLPADVVFLQLKAASEGYNGLPQ
ncbi:hypothetical protein NX786_26025 [Telluria mixta]|uniref:Lipoprotein n=1 Tax=Telluria mixta TaxID=34071 RepID=A0ABT2C5X3_9BURK|nr:hypothetical protein [Telluria mixta]MCS0632795.1 hypothetical protein [Telluria mixta]WEM97871.1 hypothetical protein P0M04_09175 [Telluria mixta]